MNAAAKMTTLCSSATATAARGRGRLYAYHRLGFCTTSTSSAMPTAATTTTQPCPRIAQAGPYEFQVKAGTRYSWCTCGHSEKQPLCDGAHKRMEGGFKPLRIVAEKDETVWFCGCKHTRTPPFCDGSHADLPATGTTS
ncbi:2 iron, 2 sulfur cluster binding [Balamuthia mandrillaris]